VRVLLEDILKTFLCEACHYEGCKGNAALKKKQWTSKKAARKGRRKAEALEAGEHFHSCRTSPWLL
jgi:hypothetical protein